MAIRAPGIRSGSRARRNVVAVLQLTAMVDMFTVLVVFLLQNYATTNQILPISETIALPTAEKVKTLKPSHTVVLSKGNVSLNSQPLGQLSQHTNSSQWVFKPLKSRMQELIKESQQGANNFLAAQIQRVISDKDIAELTKKAPFRVTIQADENQAFSEVKKLMFTLTEAGIKEMNFAVIKDSTEREN